MTKRLKARLNQINSNQVTNIGISMLLVWQTLWFFYVKIFDEKKMYTAFCMYGEPHPLNCMRERS